MTLTEDEKKARVSAIVKSLKDDIFFSPPEDHRAITNAMLEAYSWGQADGPEDVG